MSGGHFGNQKWGIEYIAEEIERIIATNDDEGKDSYGDRIGYGFSPETIAEFRIAAELLRKAYIYVHQIDYLVCSDTGEDTFLQYLKADLEKLKNEQN